ncbi:MAG: 23S rRNA (adenine(2503)-C(2))-methyltransferase RlmN [Candidatus Tectomicrobia bacterium]|uniref:Probable dual-specificity RNA methyltransferase RlmN n=1 Tax=Tectimicrobiota bacterium TaxID=2528274 RepID=A0A932CNF2_UNCTE|nr:23S rRNA (adenine(2503)-C(2))-methyltransferase RlmN [Candidatus Tectomicrobia bacterium]
MAIIQVKNLTLPELETWVQQVGEKPYRARQLVRWIYGRGVENFAEMTDLGRELRLRLAAQAQIAQLEPAAIQSATDGTQKFLFRLQDGEQIESVLIPEEDRLTLCLSSQVGCRLGCAFCLTGKQGWRRNLEPGEIVDQVCAVRRWLPPGERLTNLVLMGMGEPLDNYEAVVQALQILMMEEGLHFSNRRITLSTAGLVPEIGRLGQEGVGVNLAISLNAADNETRSRLMPINRRYPLEHLLQACAEFPLPPRRRITFEYVMIREINDRPEDARRLARILQGQRAKINLIPFNEHPGATFQRPTEDRILAFQAILQQAHYTALIRESRGREILAACGQLYGQGEEARRVGHSLQERV